MAAVITIGISPEGQRVIQQWQSAPQRIVDALDRGLDQVLNESMSHLKDNYFTGGPRPGGGKVGIRSGDLRQAVTRDRTGPLSGFVGTAEGVTSKYAATILGDETTTIEPTNAKHLWVPIADNLNPSGLARMSPREAMSVLAPNGRRLLRIFKSKAGNLVAFLPEARLASDLTTRREGQVATGAKFKRGEKKGKDKGRLLFVLKDEVVIEGTDALAKAVGDMAGRSSEILTQALVGAVG